jgi:hypothetical protein
METDANIKFRAGHERGETMLVNFVNAYQGKYYLELMEKRNIFEKFAGLFKRVTIK